MINLDRVFRANFFRFLLVFALALTPFSVFSATPLDINSATAEEFSAVMSGVGAKKAEAIMAYRNEHGPFQSVDQLSNVKGIGAALINRNRDLIRVVNEEEIIN
ncbi:ComEA family DNA-binding protein [Marinomonas transparens]|uniref:ComEA family DNA-binding protein n=1 Tax=Marinomonas transparens TaxID=2795388 RepID=A0A934JLK7_9GAMM|nr:ComEA family DNA-binding protein [Marinomonas transparens]MBJ7536608.1 ComEA family DNA-binding protein [Marinomonas transparens]